MPFRVRTLVALLTQPRILVRFPQRWPVPSSEAQAVGQKIDQDLQRFRKLVRGKVKSNLSKYISRGEMIGKKGNDYVSIPISTTNPPQFRYGKKNSGGVGVGPGQPGQPLTQPQDGEGEPQAGDSPGGHIL